MNVSLEVKDLQNRLIVGCEGFEEFPDISINFRGKLLKLDSFDYIDIDTHDCYSRLYGLDLPEVGWILGVPLLRRYYTEFNMTPGSPSVTFHPLKEPLILSTAPTAHSLAPLA